MKKIITKEEFRTTIRPKLKSSNQKIVLCHGVFDLVHPGHIIHFEQAKKMGDVLVVSITAACYVRKGPGRPYFSDELRMEYLQSIEYIDYVMLSEGYTVDDIIESVEPDIYVKGEEYKESKNDITGMIAKEKDLVEQHGGKICYTNGPVYSSTKLINTALSGIPEEVRAYVERFVSYYSMQDIRYYAEKASELKALVLGDVIVDKYTYCNIQGIMSKDMGYSARLCASEEYWGGSVAIARHLSTFVDGVTLMSIIGNEVEIKHKIDKELVGKIQLGLMYSSAVPTIVKHKYLAENSKREEYRKIFAVNNIPEKMQYGSDVRSEFLDKLRKEISKYDVVFLCDFGHGLIDKELMDIAQKNAKFLALNCQTNSSNLGLNIITKYTRADVFSLDQQELKLAFPLYANREKVALDMLSKHLQGDGWLTRGSLGCYGIHDEKISECPAFTLTVKDTVGAGDAFFSIAGIFAAAGAPIDIGTFMGNTAGALATNIIGNKEHIEKVNILKYASTLLNI